MPSTMSQPVRKASEPRLAPPRRKSRRVGSGISLAASWAKSRGSTPGMNLRMCDMTNLLTSENHGAQALRHQACHDYVDDQKADDRRHGEEMNVARRLIAAEQRRERL